MNDIRWQQRWQNYQKAYGQLQHALHIQDPDAVHIQGIIQCFEYTFELAWKTLQDYLTEKFGYDVKGPRPVLEQAFADGLIKDGVVWLDMLKKRNLTSHLYDENTVLEIYAHVRSAYFEQFTELLHFFEKNNA